MGVSMSERSVEKGGMPEEEGKLCPSCGLPAVLDDRCWSCGRISSDPEAAGTISDVEFDPLTGAYMFKKRWLTFYPVLGIVFGLYSLSWFEKELRDLLSWQGTIHPLLAFYLILLAYLVAVFVTNKTTLRIYRDRLELLRGPIPVPFARTLVLTREQVLEFTLFEQRSVKSSGVSYELLADTVDGGRTLVSFGRGGREQGARLCAFLQRTIRPSGVRRERVPSALEAYVNSHSPLYIVPVLLAGLLDGFVMDQGVTWSFNGLFWSVLGGVFLSLFAAAYLYLRQNYHARTLERLQPGEQNPGPPFYLVVAGGLSVTLVPTIMFIVNLFG